MFEVLVIAVCIGVIPGFIAQSKGRSFVAWWLYGAAIFVVALPHSLIIKKDQRELDREQLRSGSSRQCPFCAEIIKAEAVVCRFCGRDLPLLESVVDDLHTFFRDNGFVRKDLEGKESWCHADLCVMIQNGRWWLGSWNTETKDRIKRTPRHLTVQTSAGLDIKENWVCGQGVSALSTMLETYQWLASKELAGE